MSAVGSYRLDYSHGVRETYGSHAEARESFLANHPEGEIGHSGDLEDGGDRTLCWASEEDSVNDDGAKAKASIRRIGGAS